MNHKEHCVVLSHQDHQDEVSIELSRERLMGSKYPSDQPIMVTYPRISKSDLLRISQEQEIAKVSSYEEVVSSQ